MKIYLFDSQLNKIIDRDYKKDTVDRKCILQNIELSKDGNSIYLLSKSYPSEMKEKGGKYQFEITKFSKEQLLGMWEKGWRCMFDALNALKKDDLLKTIYIRTEALSVIDAINRQLAHYPYHVGQVVYLGRLIKNNSWQSLSIPKGESVAYNEGMKNK